MRLRTPRLATRLQGLGVSVFTEMTALAQRHRAVNLAQGFPDFAYAPRTLAQAVGTAAVAGTGTGTGGTALAQYTRAPGLPKLAQAVAAHERRFYGLEYEWESEVTVTCGATEAIFATVQGLCEVGDSVVMFSPHYDSYVASVLMAGAVPSLVPLKPSAPGAADTFSFDPSDLRRAVTPRTRMILLNSPHNPTGKVFSRAELAHVARVAVENDIIVVTDEVYEHLVYDGVEHVPLTREFPELRPRCVRISSAGKTFGVTGYKVGTVCAPPDLSAAVRSAHQFITFCTPGFIQHAVAEEGYAQPDAFFEGLKADFQRRRDVLCEGLDRVGLRLVGGSPPASGYFAVVDVSPLGFEDDVAFCRALPEKVGVAAIPVSAFYYGGGGPKSLVRFAFCKSDETLREGLERLQRVRLL